MLFNGIKVGKVDRVAFDPQDPRIVYAVTSVKSETPVRADTTASVGSQGLTGISYISLQGGTPSSPLLLTGDGTPTIDALAIGCQARSSRRYARSRAGPTA